MTGDDMPVCDQCGDPVTGIPYPVFVERGFIFKSQELKVFCSESHRLKWVQDNT